MMVASLAISADRLSRRRSDLGMSYAVVAARSGVSEPTVKRVLGGRLDEASFANVVAIAAALGVGVEGAEVDSNEVRRRQARAKAERIARLVQGTSGLESQAVDAAAYERLVERTYHELLAGSNRRLWSE